MLGTDDCAVRKSTLKIALSAKANFRKEKIMKKTKIVLLILSLALLIGSAVGIATSAADDKVSVISVNAEYSDSIKILIAVDVPLADAESVKVAYYTEDPSNAGAVPIYAKLCDTEGDNAITYKGTNPVFYTKGFAAKNLDDEIYITAYTGDSIPQDATYTKMSVAQYALSLLYAKDDYSSDESKAKLQNLATKVLEYGAAAQSALFDDGSYTPLTDYKYVKVNDGTVNGYPAGIFATGESVTLAYSGTDPEGQDFTGFTNSVAGAAVTSVADGQVTVSEHMVLAPAYAEANPPTTIDFEALGAAYASGGTMTYPSGVTYQKAAGSSNVESSYTDTDSTDGTNYAIQFTNTAVDTDTQWYLRIQAKSFNGLTDMFPVYGEYVFEADMKINVTPNAPGGSEDEKIYITQLNYKSDYKEFAKINLYVVYNGKGTADTSDDTYKIQLDARTASEFNGKDVYGIVITQAIENDSWFHIKAVFNRQQTVDNTNASTFSAYISDSAGSVIGKCENVNYYFDTNFTGGITTHPSVQIELWHHCRAAYTLQIDNLRAYGPK